MFHWLKRHPIPIRAFFRHCLVLTYAFPEPILRPLLPPGLTLDTHRGLGFLAIAMVQTEGLRPVGAPAALGQDFFLTGYRIFSRFRTRAGRSLRGLRILRSDTGGEADLHVIADLAGKPAALPEGSPFADLKEARRFAGPLPYTFDYEEETGSMVLIQGVRKSWDPQPVRVEVRECSFLRRPPFASETPVLANAFHLQDVPYRWERGVVEPLPREAGA